MRERATRTFVKPNADEVPWQVRDTVAQSYWRCWCDFVRSRCVVGPDEWASQEQLKSAYEEWARHVLGAFSTLKTTRRLTLLCLGSGFKRRSHRVTGKEYAGWEGIGLK